MTVILQETQRALFYAPLYVALALDAYREEGVDVRLRTSSHPDDAVRSVLTRDADVSWGGPMRVIVAADRDPASDLVCFCEVVTRDPFLLIGRRPPLDFTLASLYNFRLGVVDEVPTPWCCLQADFHRAGLDPKKLNIARSRTMAQNVAALRAGEVDVIQTLEPAASELILEAAGYIWYEAAVRGPTSYTSFYTRRPLLDRRRQEFCLMTRAIYRAQKWIAGASETDIVDALQPFFPKVAGTVLITAIANYRRLGIWGRDPRLPRNGFERLSESLMRSGLVSKAVSFDLAVDNLLAVAAISADPPSL